MDAHPHIGTDKLPGVIKAMRETICRCGGEVRFSTRVTELIIEHDEVRGVVTAGGEKYFGPVILATGHSARDVYRFLLSAGVTMEPKGLAVGVRLEHPQHLIDCLRYHSKDGRGRYLPAAEYTMLTRVDDRGVYSFCMCPGGVVIPSASGPEQLAVNGMSGSARSSRWANAAMVVEVLPEDIPTVGTDDDPEGILKMLRFGRALRRPSGRKPDRLRTLPHSGWLILSTVARLLHCHRFHMLPERIRRALTSFCQRELPAVCSSDSKRF